MCGTDRTSRTLLRSSLVSRGTGDAQLHRLCQWSARAPVLGAHEAVHARYLVPAPCNARLQLFEFRFPTGVALRLGSIGAPLLLPFDLRVESIPSTQGPNTLIHAHSRTTASEHRYTLPILQTLCPATAARAPPATLSATPRRCRGPHHPCVPRRHRPSAQLRAHACPAQSVLRKPQYCGEVLACPPHRAHQGVCFCPQRARCHQGATRGVAIDAGCRGWGAVSFFEGLQVSERRVVAPWSSV